MKPTAEEQITQLPSGEVKLILLVEDDNWWRQDVCRSLKRLKGVEVEAYAFLEAAKKAYREKHHHLVICDGTLEIYGDGLAWAQELLNQNQPVIFFPTDIKLYNFTGAQISKLGLKEGALKRLVRQML
jgi:DNA-binding NtrC family response regulator